MWASVMSTGDAASGAVASGAVASGAADEAGPTVWMLKTALAPVGRGRPLKLAPGPPTDNPHPIANSGAANRQAAASTLRVLTFLSSVDALYFWIRKRRASC